MTNENLKLTNKRRSLTLPATIYEKLKHLTIEVKHNVLDIILAFFFEGKSFCYSDLDEVTATALSFLMPDLRQAQAVFDNAKSKCLKKSIKSNEGVLGHFDSSKIQQNSANVDSSILKNKNIYNIYNNKQTNKNKQAEILSSENYTELIKNIENLKQNSEAVKYQTTIVRFEDLIQRLTLECGTQTVNGQQISLERIFERYLKIFDNKNEQIILKKIEQIFKLLDEACLERKITNSYKYSIALFYNQAMIQNIEVGKNEPEFYSREYKAEELNNLFDSLDEIDI